MSNSEQIETVELAAEIELLLQSFEVDPKTARCRRLRSVPESFLFFGVAFRKLPGLPLVAQLPVLYPHWPLRIVACCRGTRGADVRREGGSPVH